jgi:hypothetical protein
MKLRDFNFATELKLPVDIATETLAFLGRKGRGKTYGAQRWFELLFRAGVQCVALDPVGNWWSLRVGKDGKSPGLKVYVFGGPHGDVPLLPDKGAYIARVIVETGISVVLDVSRFRKAERKRFMTAFAEEFFHLKKDAASPVHLFVEEAHVFCPQRPREGEEPMLGAMEDVVRIGRNYGIGVTLISQRAATVNKDVLSQVECLIAYQTSSAQDKKAIKEWIEENEDEDAIALLKELKSLARGQALFWSPSVLRKFLKIHVTTKTTLDASSTPKVGEKARKAAKLVPVDLDKIRTSMQEVVDQAEANDVTALKRRVKNLEIELAKRVPAAAKVKEVKTKELVPLISHRQVQRIEKLATRLSADTNKLDNTVDPCNRMHDRVTQSQQALVSELDNLRREIKMRADGIEKSVTATKLPPALVHEVWKMTMQQKPKIGAPPAIGAQKHPPVRNLLRERPAAPPSGDLNESRQRILDTVALLGRLEVEISKDVLAAWYGVHPNNKGFVNNLGALRTAGYLDDLALTESGAAAARDMEIPSQEELHEKILAPLNPPQRKIMEILVENDQLEREQLAEILGVHPNNKGLTNNIGKLRSRHLATKGWPIKAGDVMRLQAA